MIAVGRYLQRQRNAERAAAGQQPEQLRFVHGEGRAWVGFAWHGPACNRCNPQLCAWSGSAACAHPARAATPRPFGCRRGRGHAAAGRLHGPRQHHAGALHAKRLVRSPLQSEAGRGCSSSQAVATACAATYHPCMAAPSTTSLCLHSNALSIGVPRAARRCQPGHLQGGVPGAAPGWRAGGHGEPQLATNMTSALVQSGFCTCCSDEQGKENRRAFLVVGAAQDHHASHLCV